MRYVPKKNLQAGHKLASDLFINRNRVLLRKGMSLTDSLVRKIDILGFQGLYIDDDVSKDLYIEEIISPELKLKTKNGLQSFFYSAENNNVSQIKGQINTIKYLVRDIVDEVLHHRQIMINIIDLRAYDDYTYSHSLNVAVLSVVMGSVLGMNQKTLFALAMGALLHDTGKMFIDKQILNKPGLLTPEEFEEIKKHSELGFQYLCKNVDVPEDSKISALHHHEQYNGGGYPNGLAQENIHIFGRIICVADVYDALTSDRPYRKAFLPSDAIEYIMSEYNNKFDPVVVKALTRKVAPYPIGTCLKLSTGDIGIVVKNFESTILRPLVKLIINKKATNHYIDLSNDRSALNITIKEIIDC
ncbi:MAG: HD-GYP domain-containing protein [Eubacteriales bacterium]|nr:HD-GYP domain-containing protein [Eubacteriales bacterium]